MIYFIRGVFISCSSGITPFITVFIKIVYDLLRFICFFIHLPTFLIQSVTFYLDQFSKVMSAKKPDVRAATLFEIQAVPPV